MLFQANKLYSELESVFPVIYGQQADYRISLTRGVSETGGFGYLNI